MADTSGPVLGIDLGTTNSVVAVADGNEVRVLRDAEGNHLIPSVVSFHSDSRILVGRDARERRLIDAANTVYSIKRLIGRPFLSPEVSQARQRLAFELRAGKTNGTEVVTRSGAYALPEISAMVLRHIRAIAEDELGQRCERAVVTVPANFNELQRSATAAAGKVAGLDVLRILNEPTAATLAYGYGREQRGSVLVYDLGGGTFDVTVLDIDKEALEVISTAGDTFLGGDDVDVAIAERFAEICVREHRFDPRTDPQAFERIRAAAEWAKCDLSSQADTHITLEELFVSGGAPKDVDFDLRREDLDGIVRPLVQRTFDVVNDALRSCGRRPKEIDHIVLVGGSTRIPLVVNMVKAFFGRMPRFERDPDLVVAQGAAIQGWMLGGRAGAAPRTAVGQMTLRRQTQLSGVKPEKRPKQPAFAPNLHAKRGDDRQARHVGDRDDDPLAAAKRALAGGVIAPRPAGGVVRVAPPVQVGRPPTSAGLQMLDDLDPVEAPPLRQTGDPRPQRKPTVLGAGTAIPAPAGLDGDAPFGARSPAIERALSERPVPTGDDLLVPRPRRPSVVSSQEDDVFFVEGSSDAIPTGSQPGGHQAAAALKAAAAKRPTGAGRRSRSGDELYLSGVELPLGQSSPDAELGLPAPGERAAPLGREEVKKALFSAGAEPASAPANLSASSAESGDGWGELALDQSIAAPPRRRGTYADIAGPSLLAQDPQAAAAVARAAAHPDPDEPVLELAFEEPEPEPPAREPAPPAEPGPVIQPSFAMGATSGPILMDVTPLSLGIETVSGYCQHLIGKNAPVPTEKTRVFATGQDDQTAVEIRICQGDSNTFAENEALGSVVLDALAQRRRGEVHIQVTFLIDSSGILDVRAVDVETKREQRTRISLRGGLDAGDIEAMRQRQELEMARGREPG